MCEVAALIWPKEWARDLSRECVSVRDVINRLYKGSINKHGHKDLLLFRRGRAGAVDFWGKLLLAYFFFMESLPEYFHFHFRTVF